MCPLPLALTETQPVASGPWCCLFVAVLPGAACGLVSASHPARLCPAEWELRARLPHTSLAPGGPQTHRKPRPRGHVLEFTWDM